MVQLLHFDDKFIILAMFSLEIDYFPIESERSDQRIPKIEVKWGGAV